MVILPSILIKATQIALGVIFALTLSSNPLLHQEPNIKIVDWDSERVYTAQINNKPAYIIFELESENIVIKKKEYSKKQDRDNTTESEIVTEYNPPIIPPIPPEPTKPTPGKVKIVFKDERIKGITFIYDRDMGDGEISETDKKYLDLVFENIEKFHSKNNTISANIKRFYDENVVKKK